MKVLRIFLAIVALFTVLAIGVGCVNTDEPDSAPDNLPDNEPSNEQQHEHEYSNEWTYDETCHWHVATCEHKDEISEEGVHLLNVVTNVCVLCGYKKIDKTPEPPVVDPEPPVTDPDTPVIEKYKLTLVNDNPQAGSSSICKDFPIEVGEQLILTAKPNYGYEFVGWYDIETDELVSKQTEYTLTMPAQDVSLTAKWVRQKFTVVVATNVGDAGTIDWDKWQREFYVGETVTIVATPTRGNIFSGWYVYNTNTLLSTSAEYTFEMPDHDVELTMRWEYYVIKVTNTNEVAGRVEGPYYGGEPGVYGTVWPVGETARLHAYPNENYEFLGWFDGDELVCSDTTYEFVMEKKNVNLTVKWRFVGYSLSIRHDGYYLAGDVACSQNNNLGEGDTVTVTATPRRGYTFVGWYKWDEFLTDEPVYTFTMPANNVTLTAKWTSYAVDVSSSDGGKVYTPDKTVTVTYDMNGRSGVCPSPITLTANDTLTYPSIPSGDGVFRGWYVDKDCSELFDFSAPLTHDVTVYAGWAPRTGNTTARFSISTLEIWNYNSADTCYNSYPNDTVDNRPAFYYFGILTEGQCTLYFKNASDFNSTYIELYNLTQGVSILSQDILNTDYQSISFYANAGDAFYLSTRRGTDSDGSICSFYVTGATLPADGGRISKVLLDEPLNVTAGEVVTLIAEADEGYVFDGWYDADGVLVSTDAEITFTMPNENVTYTAKWRQIS